MTTKHGMQRTQERTGFNAKTSARFIKNAIERGNIADKFAAEERKYLKRQEEKQGCRTKVYNAYCFILNEDNYCVTMYQVPEWFGKKRYDGKREIKNAKKYMRFNNLFKQEEKENGLEFVS